MKKLFSLFACLLCFIGFSQTREQDSLTIQLAFQKSDTTKIETSLLLIKELYNNQEYDKALKYISQTERLSQNLNYQNGIAEITYYKAMIYGFKDDYINSRDNYLKAKELLDRKSTRLNSSHVRISYAVFCLKKKKKK